MQWAPSRAQLASSSHRGSLPAPQLLIAAHRLRKACNRGTASLHWRSGVRCRRRWAVSCHLETPHGHQHQHQHHVSLHAKSEASEPLEVLLSQDIAASGSYDHDGHHEGGGLAAVREHHHHGPDLDANVVARLLTWVYR